MILNKFTKSIYPFSISIIIVFFSISSAGISEVNFFKNLDMLSPQTISEQSFCLLPDSLNQIKLISWENNSYNSLQTNGIPLFSLFDGQYNFNFLKNHSINGESISNKYNILKDSLLLDLLLYSSNYNGLLKFNYFLKKKFLYIKFNPSFESSGGYYYSNRKNENVVDLKFLENSAYQNIGLDLSAGFQNSKSNISLNILHNFSKLDVPIKLSDKTEFKQQFKKYNFFLGFLNYENEISEDFKISGNFFVKNFLRNYGSTYDSAYVLKTLYNKMMEIDEFNYGTNINFKYNLLRIDYPAEFGIFYSQNIYLFTNEFNQSRVRTESENLNISFGQKFRLVENFEIKATAKMLSRAIIYSEFGNIPENKSQYNVDINAVYSMSDSAKLEAKYSLYSVFPFVSNYFELKPRQKGNLNLNSELWNSGSLTYSGTILDFLKARISALYCSGKNVNYPVFRDTASYQYQSNGEVRALGSELGIEFELLGINFTSLSKLNFSDFSDEKLSIVQSYRLPKFSNELIITKNFDFGLNISLKSNYKTGIYTYNLPENKIEKINTFLIMDLYIQQRIFTEYLFLAVRNLTNQYYEYNYSMPEPGINFVLGLSLSF